jgi:hypothetical protein
MTAAREISRKDFSTDMVFITGESLTQSIAASLKFQTMTPSPKSLPYLETSGEVAFEPFYSFSESLPTKAKKTSPTSAFPAGLNHFRHRKYT